jgi:endoglucanase
MKLKPTGRIGTFCRRWRAVPVVAGLLAGLALPQAHADAPGPRMAVLARGINITHWFRFPPSRNARLMAGDLDDAAIASLRQVGFTYVRLSIGPEEVMDGQSIAPDKLAAIISVVGRIERAGLGVMIEPHPELMQHWNLERNAQARAVLLGFWHDLAPALKRFPVQLTFPELVNEPSFNDPAQWDAFQRQLLAVVRASLPENTVVLTGTNWSSLDGLLKVQPVADANVVYSFHTYEPTLLTLLGTWDPAIKFKQLAQYIPFPVTDEAACKAEVSGIRDAHTLAVAQYWCSMRVNETSLSKDLGRAVRWGRVHHVSVAMTEFGANGSLQPRARLAYFSAMRRATEQLGLPWAVWGLDDQMGFGQTPGAFRTASQLSPGMLRALGLSGARTSGD